MTARYHRKVGLGQGLSNCKVIEADLDAAGSAGSINFDKHVVWMKDSCSNAWDLQGRVHSAVMMD